MQTEESVSKLPLPFRRDRISRLPAANKNRSVQFEQRRAPDDTGYALLENAGVGIYGLDLDGYVTFVNPAARRMTGWTLEDLRGRTQHSMVHHSHADGSNYPREDCPIYLAFHDGRTHCRDNEVFWRKDGSSFPVEYTSTPVFMDGSITGAVVVFSDITDRLRKRAWDHARIDALQAIMRGRSIEDTIVALQSSFEVFQQGCTISIRKVSPLDQRTAQDFLYSVTDASGSLLATIDLECRTFVIDSAERTSAITDVVSLLETAIAHSGCFA